MNSEVGIIMGSKSHWEVMSHVSATLDTLGIISENRVISAHRAPGLLTEYCDTARDRGIKILICGAGLAAAHTSLPVLGVPMEFHALGGMDALLSIVQMPPGIPIGKLGIGKAGAVNSTLLAAAILALSDAKISAALEDFRAKQTQTIMDMPRPDAD